MIGKCTRYDNNELKQTIRALLSPIGGLEHFVKRGQKVLLKINLIGPKKAEKAATTNPEFVRAVGQMIQQIGADVYVGDSAGGAIAGMAPTKQAFIVAGIKAMCDQEGFNIINFDEVGPIKKEIDGNYSTDLYITSALDSVDVVINLPKMKTHSMGIYTGAVKNLFGTIPGLRKAKYHKWGPSPLEFGEFLADIHKAIDNMPLHIMDGVISMQGEGPTAGSTYPAGKILVGTDPLAIDRVAIEMMGIDADEVDILKASYQRGIGEFDLDKIEVKGDFEQLKDYKLPKRYHDDKKRNYDGVKKVIDFFKTVPMVNKKKCVHCNSCVDGCPVEAIDRDSKLINYDICIDCMCCHELCMIEAVELKGKNIGIDVIRKISALFYK
jgi:uncharacterized protein (DUF362 family)/NAD-dependent dihydropyrimidine dehydrogenase PreA subunit